MQRGISFHEVEVEGKGQRWGTSLGAAPQTFPPASDSASCLPRGFSRQELGGPGLGMATLLSMQSTPSILQRGLGHLVFLLDPHDVPLMGETQCGLSTLANGIWLSFLK